MRLFPLILCLFVPAMALAEDPPWIYSQTDANTLTATQQWKDYSTTLSYFRPTDTWRLTFRHPQVLRADVSRFFDVDDEDTYDGVNPDAIVQFSEVELFLTPNKAITLAREFFCDDTCLEHRHSHTQITVTLNRAQVERMLTADFGKIFYLKARNRLNESYERTSYTFSLNDGAALDGIATLLAQAAPDAGAAKPAADKTHGAASEGYQLQPGTMALCQTRDYAEQLQKTLDLQDPSGGDAAGIRAVAGLAQAARCAVLTLYAPQAAQVVQQDGALVQISTDVLSGWVIRDRMKTAGP